MKNKIMIIFFILTVLNFSENKKIGLALSGGTAKGLAHIGVLKVLEEEKVPIEYITGTSMGSIVGGLYSAGYTAEELEKIALEMDWIGLFTDAVPREEKGAIRNYFEDRNTLALPVDNFSLRLPNGAIGGKNISAKLGDLFYGVEEINDFKMFPQKFALVATDIETGSGVMIDSGSITTAIRSSMSIPTAISPIRYQGRLLVDGGIVRNLPVQDVKVLGADYTIGINVGEGFGKLDENKLNLLEVTTNVLSIGGREETERQKRMLDLYIEPEMKDIDSLDFSKTKEIIALGEAAARAHIDEIRKLSDPVKFEEIQAKKREFRKNWKTSYKIDKVNVEGNKKYRDEYFYKYVPKELGNLSKEDMDKIVQSVYSSGDILTVYYEINDNEMTLVVQEKASSYLLLGGNINTEDLATVTLGFQGNRVINDMNLRYSLTGIINEEYGLNGQFIGGIGTHSKAFLYTGFYIKKDIIKNQMYNGEEFDFNNRVYNVNMGLGFEFNKNLMFISGIGFEKSDVNKNEDNSKNKDVDYPFYNAELIYDSRDSIIYTTKGVYFKTNYVYGNSGDTNFNALEVIGEVNIPLTKKITLTPSLGYLTSSGDNIPETYEPKLGGYKTRDFSMKFKGIDESSIRGESILVGNLKLQYSINKYLYLDIGTSYASVSESSFSLNGNDTEQSYDMGLGLKTPLGPGFIGISKADGESVKYYLNLGYELDNE